MTLPTLSADSLANWSLRAGTTPCQPMRPIPTNLRGKKIIFTAAQFVAIPMKPVIKGIRMRTCSDTSPLTKSCSPLSCSKDATTLGLCRPRPDVRFDRRRL